MTFKRRRRLLQVVALAGIVVLLVLIMLLRAVGQQPSEEELGLFGYRYTYIGNNSAVGNLLGQLPGAEGLSGMSLQTNSEPYGLTVHYTNLQANVSEELIQEVVLYNQTVLYTLVWNLGTVRIVLDDQIYEGTREQLQQWYGQSFDEVDDEGKLQELYMHQTQDMEQVRELLERMRQ